MDSLAGSALGPYCCSGRWGAFAAALLPVSALRSLAVSVRCSRRLLSVNWVNVPMRVAGFATGDAGRKRNSPLVEPAAESGLLCPVP